MPRYVIERGLPGAGELTPEQLRDISQKSNKVIAEELGVTIKTVEAHRARVMEKMGADSLAHLVHLVMTARGARVTT